VLIMERTSLIEVKNMNLVAWYKSKGNAMLTKNSRLMKFVVAASIALVAFFSSTLYAASSSCPNSYFNDQRPDILNKRLETSARELCHDYHAVWYSGISRTPIFA